VVREVVETATRWLGTGRVQFEVAEELDRDGQNVDRLVAHGSALEWTEQAGRPGQGCVELRAGCQRCCYSVKGD